MLAMRFSVVVPPYFLEWFALNKHLLIYGHSLEETCLAYCRRARTDSDVIKRDTFLSRFKDTTSSMARRLTTTDSGYIGMGPSRARKGDKIVVLLGCSIPLVLRAHPGKTSYEVIGEFYLHEFMNGEALERFYGEESRIEEFELS